MKTSATFITEIAGSGIATVTLTRASQHNTFDDELISRLTLEFQGLGRDPMIRVVVLAAEGKSFSAGADLNWMKRVSEYGPDENMEDARALAELMKTLSDLKKPTVAAVQGPAFGGGVGLMAACDIVVAAEDAVFSLSEARLGLIPAAIGPYIIDAMGPRHARKLMLTAERFSAMTAQELGLVHELRHKDDVLDRARDIARELLQNGPRAMAEVKNLVRYAADLPVNETLVAQVAGHIARVRASAEGREGVTAFLEKRPPSWAPKVK